MTVAETITHRDFLSMADLTAVEVQAVLDAAIAIRTGELRPDLRGRSLVLLLEKPSLRTRVSFELGMRKMGGHSLSMLPQEIGIGGREPPEDVARVLSRYADVIAARVNVHQTLVDLANSADVPVINALSDIEHPCQTLADLQTIREHKGGLQGVTVAFIGDGNNVAASLAIGCALVGAKFRIASPIGYELPRRSSGKRRAWQATVERGRNSLSNPVMPSTARTSSTRMCGQAWDRRRSESSGRGTFRATKSRHS